MKKNIESKLDTISEIWNHFIWEYDFCKRRIKFTDEVKTNYLADILAYFKDTVPIIFDKKASNSYSDTFSNHISFLQSIYVQQDFIDELLTIFKCGITKGHLKLDENYSLNRGIRNELVGHPIRRTSERHLISSCLYGYNSNEDKISYLLYHKNKDFSFEIREYLISDIILRHYNFLNIYLDKVINKLKQILRSYNKELNNFKTLIERKVFDVVLKNTSRVYESIFKSYFIYDKDSLELVYNRKDEHKRYQNLINRFNADLMRGILETMDYIQSFIDSNLIEDNDEDQLFEFEYVDDLDQSDEDRNLPISYDYELGKIATNRDISSFNFFADCLRAKCLNNQIVISELKHMENNLDNDIEYYTAYKLICMELDNTKLIEKQ